MTIAHNRLKLHSNMAGAQAIMRARERVDDPEVGVR
jgi:hypothetical protein